MAKKTFIEELEDAQKALRPQTPPTKAPQAPPASKAPPTPPVVEPEPFAQPAPSPNPKPESLAVSSAKPKPQPISTTINAAPDPGLLTHQQVFEAVDQAEATQFANPYGRTNQISVEDFESKFDTYLPPIEFWDQQALDEIVTVGERHPLYSVALGEQTVRNQLANRNFFDVLLEGDRELVSEMFRRAIEPLAKRATMSPLLAVSDAVTLFGTLNVALDEVINAGIEAVTGIEDAIPVQGAVDVAEYGMRGREEVYGVAEIPPPRNTLEMLTEIAPISMIGLPITTRLNVGSVSRALLNMAEVATPFTFGAGMRRAFANTLVQTLGADVFMKIFGGDPAYESVLDMFSEQVRVGEETLIVTAQGGSPETDQTMPFLTETGVEEANQSDVDALRNAGLLAGGLIFFPGSARQGLRLLGRTTQAFRDIALPDVGLIRSYERWPDLVRVHTNDPTFVARRVLGRLGGYMTAAQRSIGRIFDREVGLAGRQRIRYSAIGQGRMESSAGTFEARDAAGNLRPYQRVIEEYARLPEDIRARVDETIEANATIARMTERGVSVEDGIRRSDLEALVQRNTADPRIADIVEGYRVNMRAAWQFYGGGQGSILDAAAAARMNQIGEDAINTRLDSLEDAKGVERVLALRSQSLTQSTDIPTLDKPAASDQRRVSPIETLADSLQEMIEVRVNNEAKLRLIDEVRRLDDGQSARVFQRVTKKQAQSILANKEHKAYNRLVSVKRNGKTEYYVTSQGLADTLKFDLPGVNRHLLYHTKRMLEQTTTGYLKPMFGVTSAIRTTMHGKVTTRRGYRKPSYRYTIASVGLQIRDRIVKQLADRFYSQLVNDGLLVKLLGERNVQALANKMSYVFDRSLTSLLLNYGGAGAGLAQHQLKGVVRTLDERLRTQSYQTRVGGMSGRTLGRFIASWKGMVDIIQNAPNYGFVARNVRRKGDDWVPVNKRNDIEDIVWESRGLGGDPRRSGQYTVHGRQFSIDPVHVKGVRANLGRWFTEVTGGGMQRAREVIPWWNPMIMGIARTGQAFLEAPLQTTMRAFVHVGLPSAAVYFWNMYWSTDEQDYIEHQMERRSDYFRTMYLPLAIPGMPTTSMVEIPLFHEMSIVQRVFTSGLDFIFRSDRHDLSFKDEALDAVASWLGIVAGTPMPPIGNAFLGAVGVAPLQNVFGGGGGGFPLRSDPYDERVEIPERIDAVVRSLFGHVANSVFDAYTAFAAGDGDIQAALEAFGDTQELATPILRELLGNPRAASQTAVSEELFAKSDTIRALMDYYTEWDPERLAQVEREGYAVTQRLASEVGLAIVSGLGDQIFQFIAGLAPVRLLPNDPPLNPLYIAFRHGLYDIFGHDTSENENAGFPQQGYDSMWRVHGQLSDSINDLRAVNHGNFVSVQNWLQNNQRLVNWLQASGIDPERDIQNLQDVRELQARLILARQDVQRVLLEGIHAVEDRMSELVGFEVRMEDLDPHTGLRPEADPSLTQRAK